MIQKKYNPITSGCSGKFGDVVFRQRGNRLVIARLSGKPHKKGTPAQKAQRNRFTEANDYATNVQYDKKLTSLYKKRTNANVNVRNLAVGDYLKAPVINDIDISQYKGRPGNEIAINAVDDFMVKAVTVSIYSSNGELLETGAAVVSPVTYKGRKTFAQTAIYIATVAHTDAVRIVVNAADLAGNVCTEEVYVHGKVLTPPANNGAGNIPPIQAVHHTAEQQTKKQNSGLSTSAAVLPGNKEKRKSKPN